MFLCLAFLFFLFCTLSTIFIINKYSLRRYCRVILRDGVGDQNIVGENGEFLLTSTRENISQTVYSHVY